MVRARELTILLDPGHGASDYAPKGTFQRPLMSLSATGQLSVVCGRQRNELDGSCHPIPDNLADYCTKYYREDFGNQQIANICKERLEFAGHKVFLTRDPNQDVSPRVYLSTLPGVLDGVGPIKRRVWGGQTWTQHYSRLIKADILIAIHTNAGKSTGCAAFYNDPPGKILGECITKELYEALNLHIRRVDKHGYIELCNNAAGRTCLIECAFHDNPQDLAILTSQEGITKIGECLAKGIDKFAADIGLIPSSCLALHSGSCI